MSENEQIFPGKMLTKDEDAMMNMKNNFLLMCEYHKHMAKLHKVKYDALIENKFTPEQALELCKVL